MTFVKNFTTLISRVLLSSIFLVSGIQKIIYWQDTEKELIKVLNEWESVIAFSTFAQTGISIMMHWAPLFLILATLFELVGSLLLLFGIKERLGAVLLILFLLPATFLFHQFWFLEGMAHDVQMSLFFRNFGLIGGLLMVVLHGASMHHESDDSRMAY